MAQNNTKRTLDSLTQVVAFIEQVRIAEVQVGVGKRVARVVDGVWEDRGDCRRFDLYLDCLLSDRNIQKSFY